MKRAPLGAVARFHWLAAHELAMGIKPGKEEAAIESIIQFLAGLKIGGM